MNILHLNTYDIGGAAKACIRLHQGLLKAGINSKLLVAEKRGVEDISECYVITNPKKGETTAVASSEASTAYQTRLLQTKDLPKGYEGFNFPYSLYQIEKHWLYDWADIIQLHWVARFLDWTTFFQKNKKPIVWTLHDMLPFSGGYHYEKGFPIAAYHTLIQNNLAIKKTSIRRAIPIHYSLVHMATEEIQDKRVISTISTYSNSKWHRFHYFQALSSKFSQNSFKLTPLYSVAVICCR